MAASDLLHSSLPEYDFQWLEVFFFLTTHQGTLSLVSNGYQIFIPRGLGSLRFQVNFLSPFSVEMSIYEASTPCPIDAFMTG